MSPLKKSTLADLHSDSQGSANAHVSTITVRHNNQKRKEVTSSEEDKENAKVTKKLKRTAIQKDKMATKKADNLTPKKMKIAPKTIEKYLNDLSDYMLSNLLKMQKTTSSTNFELKRMVNREIFNDTGTFNELPFLVGKKPDDLVTIENIEDLNALTLEQVKIFLVGYGKPIDGEATDLRNDLAYTCGVPPSSFPNISKKSPS
jgi:hypothetical protein